MKLKSSKTRNLAAYSEIHLTDAGYGKTSEELVSQIARYARELSVSSVLDFGCGKSKTVDLIGKLLNCKVYRYDPAIVEYSKLPVSKSDLVINTDVLEHLDIHEVDYLLSDIAAITQNAYFNISTRPAVKLLSNGENAHATVRSKIWWECKIREYFPTVVSVPSYPDEARFITWKSSKSGKLIEIIELLHYGTSWVFKRFRYLAKRVFRRF